jgi:hypothetical protein
MLPVAAARATKSKTSSARLQRARPSSPRAPTFQARHSKSNSPFGSEAAGVVNTDFSGRHARTTKRAGPERAFERDALKVSTRDSAFDFVASAHSRTQGRNAQNTQDATIATATPERAKLWRESASATKFQVGPPLVQPPAPRR